MPDNDTQTSKAAVHALHATVHVMRVGGNKLTKTMLAQIPECTPEGTRLMNKFGYVRSESDFDFELGRAKVWHTYIGEYKGSLYKYTFRSIYDPFITEYPQIYIGV